MRFTPNQMVNYMLIGESFDGIIPMLPNSFKKIGSDTDIESSISLTCKYIDARLLHDSWRAPLRKVRRWILDRDIRG